jgi:outer membrane protein OmpU
MKKILLASSALALTASVAAAEITLGGDAYYGIVYLDNDNILINNTTGNSQNYAFAFDLDFDITASGETDSGLIFGAAMDIDEMDTSQGFRGWDSEIFVSGAFGRLAMGDVDGAAEAIVGDLNFTSLTGLGDFNENIYLLGAGDPTCERAEDVPVTQQTVVGTDDDGNDVVVTTTSVDDDGEVITMEPEEEVTGACGQGPLALYTYDFEGFTGAIGLNDDEGYSIGAGYDGGTWNVGLAYESVKRGTTVTVFDAGDFISDAVFTVDADSNTDHWIGVVGVDIAGVVLKGVYGYIDPGSEDLQQYGISAEYTFDAVTVGAWWREVDPDVDDVSKSVFAGLGVAYDLGGGLSVVASYAYLDVDTGETEGSTNAADFGLSFAF